VGFDLRDAVARHESLAVGVDMRERDAHRGITVPGDNPYANAPETTLEHAVATLSVPLRLKSRSGHYVRPNEQEIVFRLAAN